MKKKYSVEKSEESAFEGASWIWPQSHNWDIHNGYALFRKEIRLTGIPKRAFLAITADQSYQLYVNGSYVCRGPARGFQSHWPFDRVDIRKFLQKGLNLIAVRAYNPGHSNFQYLSQGFAGLLVSGTWGGVKIRSDRSWRCCRQVGVAPATVPASLQLFAQEHIDLREEDPSWMLPEFDDSAWSGEVAAVPWNSMPWSRLEERGIPMLDEKVVTECRLIGSARGACASDYRSTRDVTRLRHAEGLGHLRKEFPATEICAPPTGRGKFRSYLFDFGRTTVGSMGFTISGAAGGEIVDTLHVETIDEATLTPDFIPDRHCRMAFGHRLICKEGSFRHTFYHTFGFRYMVITIRDSRQEIRLEPHVRTTLYPLDQTGGFATSDALLGEIWDACAWTQRVCSMDAYVDTPWREQAQWWGDARVQAKNTFFLSADDRLFRRGIAQIGSQVTPSGLTYGHAPTMAHTCILPDFTLIWLITLWDFYWQTGSLEPFLAHQDTIRQAVGYFEKMAEEITGLVPNDSRYWLFLDWADLFKEGYSTVYNLWLLIALEKLAKMYSLARQPRAARKLSLFADRLRKSLRTAIRADGLLHDGWTLKGEPARSCSIHSQTLAIMAGLDPKRDAIRIDKSLLPFLSGESHPKVAPSAYWVNYLFEVLTNAGRGNEVLDYIGRHWGPMARHGTTWEVFEPVRGDQSFSHAWSAHPLYHLMQTIGGIRQAAPEWREIIYQPIFRGECNETVVPTPLGKIRGSWTKDEGKISVMLELPEGMKAAVCFPCSAPFSFEGQGVWNIAI